MTRNGRQPSVLVVNEEPFIRHLLSRMVAREGYSVTEVSSSEAALSYLEKGPVDFVISEMEMPKIDGRQLLTKVRELYPATKVLFITPSGTHHHRVKSEKAKADDYITKPFKNVEIARTLSNLAMRHRQPAKSHSG